MKPEEMIVSNWLKAELEKRNMTKNAFAEVMSSQMSRASVFNYISGARIPNRKQIEKLATALNLPHSEIPDYEVRKIGAPAHKR